MFAVDIKTKNQKQHTYRANDKSQVILKLHIKLSKAKEMVLRNCKIVSLDCIRSSVSNSPRGIIIPWQY